MTAEHVKGPFGHTTAVGQSVDSVPTSVVRRLTDTMVEQTAFYQRSSIAVICVSAPVNQGLSRWLGCLFEIQILRLHLALWRQIVFKLVTVKLHTEFCFYVNTPKKTFKANQTQTISGGTY